MIYLKEKNSESLNDRARMASTVDRPAQTWISGLVEGGTGRSGWLAMPFQGLRMRSKDRGSAMGPVERLDALTSEEPSERERLGWFECVSQSLESLLADREASLLSEELDLLVRLEKPELLVRLDGLQRRRARALTEIWDLVYLLRRLGGSAEVDVSWLCQRLRSCLLAQREIDTDVQEFTFEILWCDLGGEGG